MRAINRIIIHSTATPEGRDVRAADVERWHRARGWNGIGYHHVVLLDGTVEAGRAERLVGAHTVGQNANSIGVVYIGGTDTIGRAKDTRTPAQCRALYNLICELRVKYPNATIHGHKDFTATACPSFDATKEYANL